MGGHDDVATQTDPLRELGSALRDSSARVLVAESEARVVGVAFVQARSSLASNVRVAWLSAVAVDETLRRRGVGRALLAAVDGAARSLGCEKIALQSSARRTRAHAFYRANAYVEAPPAVLFSRSVPRPRADASIETKFLAAAARAASAVNAAIVGLGDAAAVGMGADGAQTEAADRAAERAALAVLCELGVPIVSEEAGLVGVRIGAGDNWIALDPLDGSRNFRAGQPPYATAMGLVRDGVACAGFVCDLSSGRRWWADANGPAYADGRPVRARRGELIGMPSPSREDDVRRPKIRHRARISGSCAIDLCRVADGSLSAFVALTRAVVHVHDLAGPAAILRAAGASFCDERGERPLLVPDPARAYRLVAAADVELARTLASRDRSDDL